MSPEQIEEVPILGDYYRAVTAPLAFNEDRMILGVAEAEVANGDRFNPKRAREPRSQRWCYLRIDEDEH